MAGILSQPGTYRGGGVLSDPNIRSQALSQGLLAAGAGLLQGGQGNFLQQLGTGLTGFDRGYQGALDRSRDDRMYDLKLAGMEREQSRQDAAQNAAQGLLDNMPENPPPAVLRAIEYHVQAQDPETAASIYHDWATTPPDTDAPTVREFYDGDRVLQKSWNKTTQTWDVMGEGARWAPQQPDQTLVPIHDPSSPTGVRYVPRGQAAGQPAAGSGGVTPPQVANNFEIDAARNQLAGYSPEELESVSQQTDAYGVPNPNYQANLASLVSIARQHKVGVPDPDFDQTWSNIYGGGALQGGGGSPGLAVGGEPPRSFMGDGVSGTFTGEYEGGQPVYKTPDGRRFVVEQ